MPKNAVRPINSSKNKLNDEIIYNFNPHSNAHLRLRFHYFNIIIFF